jgi:hypothetical protein
MRTHGWFGLLGLCAALLASPAVAVAAGPDAFVVPGTPTALQAGQPRLGEPVWLTPIWALSSAGVTRRAWSGARHTWAFPDTEDPAAAFDDGEGQVVVLDRASASVSAFKATPGAQTLRRVRRNAVGQDPVAMTAVDLRDGDADGYAVADRGSNDVSVLKATGSGQGAKFGLTRVAVGAQPDAIASGAIDSDSHADLAVDDSGSDAVSLLFGDGKGGFPTRIDISLPAAPTALAVTNPTSRTLLSGTPAVVVATADGSVWFIGAGRRPQARRVISGLGDPIAVVALALNYDRNLDLAVIDRAAGTLDVLYGTGPGRFAAPVIAWHGRDPVAVTGGSFGADALDDLAVADAATATVTLVLTPGDQRLAPPEPTLALANYQGNLVARDGWLAWVRAVSPSAMSSSCAPQRARSPGCRIAHGGRLPRCSAKAGPAVGSLRSRSAGRAAACTPTTWRAGTPARCRGGRRRAASSRERASGGRSAPLSTHRPPRGTARAATSGSGMGVADRGGSEMSRSFGICGATQCSGKPTWPMRSRYGCGTPGEAAPAWSTPRRLPARSRCTVRSSTDATSSGWTRPTGWSRSASTAAPANAGLAGCRALQTEPTACSLRCRRSTSPSIAARRTTRIYSECSQSPPRACTGPATVNPRANA